MTVHPRAGGELYSIDGSIQPHFGSSPRGRGTPLQRFGVEMRGRFIPARAGNSVLCKDADW